MSFLIRQTLIYAVPLMIVALAGIFAERSGIINLALEGIMIFGAFVGVLFVRIMQILDAEFHVLAEALYLGMDAREQASDPLLRLLDALKERPIPIVDEGA